MKTDLTRHSILYLLALTVAGTATSAFSAQNSTEQDKASYEARLQETGDELAQLQSLLETAAQERIRLQKEMQRLNSNADERETRVSNLNHELRNYEEQVRELETQTELFSKTIEGDREQLVRLVKQRQITRDNSENASTLKILLSGRDVWLAKRRAVYLSYLEHASQQRLQELKTRLESLDNAKHEAIKSRNWLAHLGNKARNQQTTLLAEARKKQTSIKSLDSEQKKHLESRQHLLDVQKNIESILAELAQRKKVTSGYFAGLQQSLPWPSGSAEKVELLARFGQRKAGGKLTWSGLLLKRRNGQPVTAIADGTVVYANTLASLGIVVVVDHGDSYLSLYGGNSEAAVAPGDWVEMGSTIATVGKIAGPNRETTYLEIRENAVPVNPEEWLNAKKRIQLAAN